MNELESIPEILADVTDINAFMAIDENTLYVIDSKKIFSLNLVTGKRIFSHYEFKKNSLSRKIITNSRYVYIKEFCTVCEYIKPSLEKTREWIIGENLSSDITGICCDEEKVYLGIRNGGLTVLDIDSGYIAYYNICSTSMWDITEEDNYLYAGSVDTHLLKIQKNPISIVNKIKAHKKNCKDVLIYKDSIYTASSDMSIKRFEKSNLNLITEKRKAFDKMFAIIGICNETLVCSSINCKSTKFFNFQNLNLIKSIPIFSRNMCIYENKILFNDRYHIYSLSVCQ
ncbi:MAG: hypothetical protein WC332_02060 [Clostridia bacterium]|jgi:hypothetical protein